MLYGSIYIMTFLKRQNYRVEDRSMVARNNYKEIARGLFWGDGTIL